MSLGRGKTKLTPTRGRSAILATDWRSLLPAFLPCAAGRPGRWESGNPDFGFPLFHGPIRFCFWVLLWFGKRVTAGSPWECGNRRCCDFQAFVGTVESLQLAFHRFHNASFPRTHGRTYSPTDSATEPKKRTRLRGLRRRPWSGRN